MSITFNHQTDTITVTTLTLSGTGALQLQSGTTGQRPGSPASGMLRHNSTTGKLEAYLSGTWSGLSLEEVGGVITLADGTEGDPTLQFATDLDTGMFKPAANSIGFSGAGLEQVRIVGASSTVNRLELRGSTTGNAVSLTAAGSDSNIGLNLVAAGTQSVDFTTGGGLQARVGNTASAVNYLQITGGATGQPVYVYPGGETNVALIAGTRGTGAFRVLTNGAATEQFRIAHTASAVNYWQLTGSATGNALLAQSQGSDSNIGFQWLTKGTGEHYFDTGSTGNRHLAIIHTASAVNRWELSGAATGNKPYIQVAGSDSSIAMEIWSKNNGLINFRSSSTGNPTILSISPASSVVNYTTVFGGTTGNIPKIIASGSDTNVGLGLYAQADDYVYIGSQGTSGLTAFKAYAATGSVNHISALGAGTGSKPSINSTGSDTHVGLQLNTKGASSTITFDINASPAMVIGAQGSGTNVLYLLNGTAPSSNPASGGYVYVESGVLKFRDPAGIISVLSGGASNPVTYAGTTYTLNTGTTLTAGSHGGKVGVADASGGGFTVTLPSAASGGSGAGTITITKIDSSANVVTVQRAGADVINEYNGYGATTILLEQQGQVATLWSDGTAWYTIAALGRLMPASAGNDYALKYLGF